MIKHLKRHCKLFEKPALKLDKGYIEKPRGVKPEWTDSGFTSQS